jgi:hypothetical protein
MPGFAEFHLLKGPVHLVSLSADWRSSLAELTGADKFTYPRIGGNPRERGPDHLGKIRRFQEDAAQQLDNILPGITKTPAGTDIGPMLQPLLTLGVKG